LPHDTVPTSNGIDLIEISRIRAAVRRWGDHFLNRIFCPEEISYAGNHRNPYPHYAARFAAKEAVIKAAGNFRTLHRKDIKILNDPGGRPYCIVNHKSHFNKQIFISISHTRAYAIASAIIAP